MRRYGTTFASLVLILLVGIVAIGLVLPAWAQPHQQNGSDFATPTPNPVNVDEVVVEIVGGQYETVTYDGEITNGFVVGETTATSNYPNGVTFIVRLEGEADISGVTLLVRYPHGSGTRAVAEPTDNDFEWQAILYDRPGQPPWQEFEFHWSINDADGDFIETEPQHFIYNDPTREWFKAETPLLRLYWFGYPEEFGQIAMEGMYAVRERHEVGFGGGLSFVPIAVLFADVESFAEFRAGGTDAAARLAGFTSNDLGMTVQRFIERGNSSSCPTRVAPADQTIEWLYNTTVTTITHEVTHLYQYDFNVSGPTWFTEGGATWFSLNPDRGRQEGLRDRDADEDLPTLQGTGPGYRIERAPNGCNALAYWMGTSFYNFMYGTYGLEAIGEWHDLLSSNTRMDDALIQVTGKNLLELEQDWRVYLGLAADPYIRPTEPYAFPPTVTPFGQ